MSRSGDDSVHSPNQKSIAQAQTLVWISCGLFALGLLLPCMTMTPHMNTAVGDLMKVWGWFSNSAKPQTISIIGGIWHLIIGGDIGLGLLLAGFSVAFPTYKLLVMAGICTLCRTNPGRHMSEIERSVHRLAVLGKWSMLDVFVLGLIVVSFKAFPGGTTVSLDIGTYFFGASVVLSMIATASLKSALRLGGH